MYSYGSTTTWKLQLTPLLSFRFIYANYFLTFHLECSTDPSTSLPYSNPFQTCFSFCNLSLSNDITVWLHKLKTKELIVNHSLFQQINFILFHKVNQLASCDHFIFKYSLNLSFLLSFLHHFSLTALPEMIKLISLTLFTLPVTFIISTVNYINVKSEWVSLLGINFPWFTS